MARVTAGSREKEMEGEKKLLTWESALCIFKSLSAAWTLGRALVLQYDQCRFKERKRIGKEFASCFTASGIKT